MVPFCFACILSFILLFVPKVISIYGMLIVLSFDTFVVVHVYLLLCMLLI